MSSYTPRIYATRVRGELVHPNCTTPDEALLTAMFYGEPPEGNCERCGEPFAPIARLKDEARDDS